jgi:L-rhamnose isomerase/sugar isomerase
MARAEQRIPSVIKSVEALKLSVAKAVLADFHKLKEYQKNRDLIGANVEFECAFLHADTGPIMMESFFRQGLHPLPLVAYKESWYQERIEKKRVKYL